MNTDFQPNGTFDALGLSPAMLSVLDDIELTTPTPIQEQAIPIAMQGSDLIGVAQTGTGKTLAFALPLIEKLRRTGGKALILVPTRELALQVDEVVRGIASRLKPAIRTVVLIGGTSMYGQLVSLRSNPRIIVATPGRLIDHMQQRTVNLSTVETLILDEADRMFDMGFIRPITQIFQSVPQERQTLLFSATMSSEVTDVASKYMRQPQTIQVAASNVAAEHVEQQLCYVEQNQKADVLNTLLETHKGSVLVFSRTKHGAAKLSRSLSAAGHNAVEIHANRSLGQRRHALNGFKSGQYRVLVATDIAARGIDVQDIGLVVNYDLPDAPTDYVHRIGRTGRAGKAGLAISLASHDQYNDVRVIERMMNATLPLSELSDKPRMQAPAPRGGQSRFGNRRPGSSMGRRDQDSRPGGMSMSRGNR
jgi:ATP-dependent RNA helicase RhlE